MELHYPFSELDKPYICPKCNQLLRRSYQNHIYVISEYDHDEIIHKNHGCRKDKNKGGSRRR